MASKGIKKYRGRPALWPGRIDVARLFPGKWKLVARSATVVGAESAASKARKLLAPGDLVTVAGTSVFVRIAEPSDS